MCLTLIVTFDKAVETPRALFDVFNFTTPSQSNFAGQARFPVLLAN
jgi:hypothetical protein